MGSAVNTQRKMDEIQKSQEFADIFSKLVSGGRAGYKTVIDNEKPVPKCESCGNILSGNEKFCPECGNKI